MIGHAHKVSANGAEIFAVEFGVVGHALIFDVSISN